MESSFILIAAVVLIGMIMSLVMRLLKQPLIIGHIVTGILIGPSFFNYISSGESVGLEVFSKMGIALLLFLIGLGLNPKVIKETGKTSAISGIGQVVLTVVISLLVLLGVGYGFSEAIYVATALAFSSTIIVLKLLNDKKETPRLHGKIAVGFLLVQDIIATVAMIFVSTSSQGGFEAGQLLSLGIKGLAVFAVLIGISQLVIKRVGKFISGSQEFLFIFSIAWGLGVAAVFQYVGLSIEIGALAAGVVLASSNFAVEAASRLKPLRDFFIFIFFVMLGATLNLNDIAQSLPMALLLSLMILIIKPLIVIGIMGVLGYTKKVGFKVGLSISQISEFSLVLIILANSRGIVSDLTVSLVTMVALITIVVSTYLIMNDEKIFSVVSKYIGFFEKKIIKAEREYHSYYDAIIVGYRKGGHEYIKTLVSMGKKVLVVDYDPCVIETIEHARYPVSNVYGDASDLELMSEVGLDRCKICICSATNFDTNRIILSYLNRVNEKCIFICSSESYSKATELYEMGASYVVLPHTVGGDKLSGFIKKNGLSKVAFKHFRQKHLEELYKEL